MSATTKLHIVADRLRRTGLRSTARAVASRGVATVSQAWALDEPSLPLRTEDIRMAPATPGQRRPLRPATGEVLRVGWICTPPGPGSGGHTTLFRMVRAMEERGHECTLLLYDRNADDVFRHEQVIREYWPQMRAVVRSATARPGDLDAIVASSWPTAHVAASRFANVMPFYFVQDYEPFFYPRGYLYTLAEATYRLGLDTIALGGMVATAMEREAGVRADATVPFGCDTQTYRLVPAEPGSTRHGVVYYAKRSADRRGYLLAKDALELFHRRCPDQPIHVVGDQVRGWSVPVIQHGSVPPSRLNEIYNQTIAGLALSFTNVSLVPGELLASGNVPVLNDLPGPRLDLVSPDAVWAPGTPDGLADALARAVQGQDLADGEDIGSRARRIAAGPHPSWSVAQAGLVDHVEKVTRAVSVGLGSG